MLPFNDLDKKLTARKDKNLKERKNFKDRRQELPKSNNKKKNMQMPKTNIETTRQFNWHNERKKETKKKERKKRKYLRCPHIFCQKFTFFVRSSPCFMPEPIKNN